MTGTRPRPLPDRICATAIHAFMAAVVGAAWAINRAADITTTAHVALKLAGLIRTRRIR